MVGQQGITDMAGIGETIRKWKFSRRLKRVEETLVGKRASLQRLEASLQCNPSDAEAANQLGLCCDALGKFDTAAAHYALAKEICWHHQDYDSGYAMMVHRADSLLKGGHLDEGRQVIESVLQESEAGHVHSQARAALASVLCNLDRLTEAEGVLPPSLDKDPRTATARFASGVLLGVRGRIRAQRGDLTGAGQDFERARRYLAGSASGTNEVKSSEGVLQARLGHTRRGLTLLESAFDYFARENPCFAGAIAKEAARLCEQASLSVDHQRWSALSSHINQALQS